MIRRSLYRLPPVALLAFALLAGGTRHVHAMGAVATLQLGLGEDMAQCGVIDSSHTFAYFGSGGETVSQIRLSDFTESALLFIGSGLISAGIDPLNNLYFGEFTSPGTVQKFTTTPFAPGSTLPFTPGQDNPTAVVIDTGGVYGYFGTSDSPGVVVKVHLSDLTLVGALTLQSGENLLGSAVIDPTGTNAYFGTQTIPGKIVKVRLSDFTEQGTLTLSSGNNDLTSAVIDSTGAFAYFGTSTNPGRVVKVNLSNFTVQQVLTLTGGASQLISAVMDNPHHNAYFGDATGPANVVRIILSEFSEGPTISIGTTTVTAGAASAVIDPVNDYAYFGTLDSPGAIVKVDLLDTRTGPPVITQQPNSPVVNPGQIATFTVGAGGSSPLSYQWLLNGSPILGATSSTYETPPVTLADDAGQYACTVSNPLGSVTSSPGTLTVKPVIRVYPNPWRVDRYGGTPITFDHMAPNSTVKIFTTSMHWVRTLTTNTGSVTWDLTNDSGQKVASGYYFYLVKTGRDSQTSDGKIAIIR